MPDYTEKFIGGKKIKQATETKDTTPSGIALVEVTYEDGGVEWFSSLMFDKIVSEESCDASALRDKRVEPVVEKILAIIRDWGLKLGELQYMSARLNQSLDYNQKEALLELWAEWMPRPNSPDEIDYITIDRVLRSIKQKTVADVLGNGKSDKPE